MTRDATACVWDTTQRSARGSWEREGEGTTVNDDSKVIDIDIDSDSDSDSDIPLSHLPHPLRHRRRPLRHLRHLVIGRIFQREFEELARVPHLVGEVAVGKHTI